MNVKSLAILCLVGVKFLSAAGGEAVSTEVVLQQAMNESAGKKAFKTVMVAANRYGEAQLFAGLIRRVGLQYGLNNYGGKKNPRGKRITKFLSLLPQGQKITLLAPLGSALNPIIGKIRAAEDSGDKAALKTALEGALMLVKNHIIKGEFTQATLKGQMETLGGTKINADNLQFHKADVLARNGVFHVIKRLSTDEPEPVAAEPAAPAVVKTDVAAPTTDKPADGAKSAEAVKPAEVAKPAEVKVADPAKQAEAAKPADKAAEAKGAEPAKTVDKPAEAKPAEPVKAAEPTKPADKLVEGAKVAEPAKPAEAAKPADKPAATATAAEAPAAAPAKVDKPADAAPAAAAGTPPATPAGTPAAK